MNDFKQYRRKQIAELREVTLQDINNFKYTNSLLISTVDGIEFRISISDVDLSNGSPKLGDMIARNVNNHNDQWLVEKAYFEENFEELNNFHTTGDNKEKRVSSKKWWKIFYS